MNDRREVVGRLRGLAGRLREGYARLWPALRRRVAGKPAQGNLRHDWAERLRVRHRDGVRLLLGRQEIPSLRPRRHSVGFPRRGRDPEEVRPVHLSGGTPVGVPPYRPCPPGAPHPAPTTTQAHRAQRKPPLASADSALSHRRQLYSRQFRAALEQSREPTAAGAGLDRIQGTGEAAAGCGSPPVSVSVAGTGQPPARLRHGSATPVVCAHGAEPAAADGPATTPRSVDDAAAQAAPNHLPSGSLDRAHSTGPPALALVAPALTPESHLAPAASPLGRPAPGPRNAHLRRAPGARHLLGPGAVDRTRPGGVLSRGPTRALPLPASRRRTRTGRGPGQDDRGRSRTLRGDTARLPGRRTGPGRRG